MTIVANVSEHTIFWTIEACFLHWAILKRWEKIYVEEAAASTWEGSFHDPVADKAMTQTNHPQNFPSYTLIVLCLLSPVLDKSNLAFFAENQQQI